MSKTLKVLKKWHIRIIDSPYTKSEARSPFILPILSRLDKSSERADDWLEKFAKDFAFLIPILDDDLKAFGEEVLEQISALTFLEYNRLFSTGEKIHFKASAPRIKAGSALENFEYIALNILEEMNREEELDLSKLVGDKMIPIYRRIIKEFPEVYEAYLGLGLAYQGLENFTEAEKYYQKAIEINQMIKSLV